MHVIAVLNRHGGTFRTLDLDAFCTEARAIFAAHGHSVDFRIVDGNDLCGALAAAAKEHPDALMAGGGDGTISAAASIAYETGVPLAVLPAGTMNLFARTLRIPLALPEAVRALADGELAEVDIATANGKVFVHQFGVGIHARLVRIRESLTYKSRLGKILASWRAILAAIVRPPRFVAEIRTPRGIERRETSGINVFNNPAGEGHIPYADGLDRGLLGVYVTKPLSSLDLAGLALAVFLGRWKANTLVTEREIEQLTLRFPRRKRVVHAVVDGELIDLSPEVELRSHPRALRVLVPKAWVGAPDPASAG